MSASIIFAIAGAGLMLFTDSAFAQTSPACNGIQREWSVDDYAPEGDTDDAIKRSDEKARKRLSDNDTKDLSGRLMFRCCTPYLQYHQSEELNKVVMEGRDQYYFEVEQLSEQPFYGSDAPPYTGGEFEVRVFLNGTKNEVIRQRVKGTRSYSQAKFTGRSPEGVFTISAGVSDDPLYVFLADLEISDFIYGAVCDDFLATE